MGSRIYDEIEGLKAQAIAARMQEIQTKREDTQPIRTRTVAFCRSADGTVVITWAGMRQSG